MGVWSALVKVGGKVSTKLKGVWGRLIGSGAAGAVGAGGILGTVAAKGNRFLVGVGVAIAGFIGLDYANENDVWGSIADWMLGTPDGLVVLLIILALLFILIRRIGH